MNRCAVAVVIVAAVVGLLAAGLYEQYFIRREAARNAFLHALELVQRGSWEEASTLAQSDYVQRFRGDFAAFTNELSQLKPGFTLNGGWNYVQVRYEYQNQPEWGVFFELRPDHGKWLIVDRGRWTSSEF